MAQVHEDIVREATVLRPLARVDPEGHHGVGEAVRVEVPTGDVEGRGGGQGGGRHVAATQGVGGAHVENVELLTHDEQLPVPITLHVQHTPDRVVPTGAEIQPLGHRDRVCRQRLVDGDHAARGEPERLLVTVEINVYPHGHHGLWIEPW
jgi:hypothetical protein